MKTPPRLCLLVVFLAAALSACSAPLSSSAGTLTVLAAASLRESFTEIGKAFEARHAGARVAFNFAGSQQLRTQIEQGGRADVFASADMSNMTPLARAGLLAAGYQIFAHNRLVIIMPASNPAGLKEVKDLARAGVKLVLADASVPAGNYARQALDKFSSDLAYGTDFKARVLANVASNETDVKAVVSKVSLGEADAGIVYVTDAHAASDKLAILTIPDAFNIRADYPIATLKGAEPLAQTFVDFVLSDEGQAILNQYGFERK